MPTKEEWKNMSIEEKLAFLDRQVELKEQEKKE